MKESGFNFKSAIDALKFLETDVYTIIKRSDERTAKMIRENKIPKDMPLGLLSVLSNESFYLGYPNSISLLKGTLLKYRLLYLKEKLLNSKTKEKAIKKEYEKAKLCFCNFVGQADYVD